MVERQRQQNSQEKRVERGAGVATTVGRVQSEDPLMVARREESIDRAHWIQEERFEKKNGRKV